MNNNLINILWVAKSEYPAGSCLSPHSHDYYQIYYVVSGEGDFIIGDRTVTMGRGMYLFTRPNDIHGISAARDVNNEPLRMLEAKYAVFDSELRDLLDSIPNVCKGRDEIQELLELVFREAIEMSPWYLQIATHTLITTLYYMLRFDLIEISNSTKQEIVKKTKKYINENYKNDVSLDKVSHYVGCSKNYICKIFKEYTGMTVNHYLNKVRIDKAAELLVNTNLDVSEIASNVGYNNVYHFIKTFKKIVGTSPGNFRKNELSGNALVSSQVRAIAIIPAQRTRNDV